MPLDDLTDVVSQSYRSTDLGIHFVNNWHLHFCLWPRRCRYTDKTIWFKLCYKGSRSIQGLAGEKPLVIEYYIDKFEFIIWNLKGKP